jgi:hypothetical protein
MSSWTSRTAGRCGKTGFRPSAMRDGVWDRTTRHQREYKEYIVLRRDDGGTGRHLITFRIGLGLRSIRSQRSNRYRLAVKIRQSTAAQRRPEFRVALAGPCGHGSMCAVIAAGSGDGAAFSGVASLFPFSRCSRGLVSQSAIAENVARHADSKDKPQGNARANRARHCASRCSSGWQARVVGRDACRSRGRHGHIFAGRAQADWRQCRGRPGRGHRRSRDRRNGYSRWHNCACSGNAGADQAKRGTTAGNSSSTLPTRR